MFRLGISIESFPYIFTQGEVTIPSTSDATKWEPSEDMPNGCGQVEALDVRRLSWSEIMTLVDGGLDVSGITFSLRDVPVSYNGSDVKLCSYLLARDPAYLSSTVLTRSVTEAGLELSIPTIAASALTSGYPKVLYLGDEAIYCDSYSGGTITVNSAGRGYYGSRARAYQYQADQGLYPEVWAEPPGVMRRRVILWAFDDDGKAYALWRGVVTKGPELQRDSTWTISCDHVWTVEKNRVLGDSSASCKPLGFEPSAVSVGIECQNSFAGGTFDAGIRTWHGWNAAGTAPLGGDVSNGAVISNPDLFCEYLQRTLAARLQATSLPGTGVRPSAQTNVAVRVERAGRRVTLSVRCGNNGNQPTLVARVLTKEVRSNMKDEGGGVYSGSLDFDLPEIALTFVSAKRNELQVNDTARLTARLTSDENGTERRSTRTWQDGAFRTTVRDVLAGNYDEGTRFVVYPEVVAGGLVGRMAYVTRDGAPASNANTQTFGTYALGGFRAYFGANDYNQTTIFLDRAIRLTYTQWVTCDHWIYGLQHALEDATLATDSDSRNWDFSEAEQVARATAHELTAREWYLDGSMKINDLIADTIVLDGCGVAIRSGGRLAIVPVRQPLAHWSEGYESSAITATITKSDLKHGSVPTWRRVHDALVSDARVLTSVEGATIRDGRSRQKWGKSREIDLSITGLPQSRQGGSDAASLASRVLHRVLGLWAEPRFAVTFELPLGWLYGTNAIHIGDFVLLSEWHLPTGTGSRGLSSAAVFVFGREPSLDGASVRLHALLLPTCHGFAPCIKVNDMTIGYPSAGKTTIVADTQYIYSGSDDENDYAGAIASDLGVGWFKAGDKVALYLRDDTSGQREVSLTVESVDTVNGSLVVTPEVPLVPYDWDAAIIGGLWVDLVYDQAVVLTDEGQKSFAFVGTGNAGDGTIAFSGDTQRSRKYGA